MNVATLIALLRLYPEFKTALGGFNLKPNQGKVNGGSMYVLDLNQCQYVGHVYLISRQHNKLYPFDSVSEEELVSYFNSLFEKIIPIHQYRKIWQNYQPKRVIHETN